MKLTQLAVLLALMSLLLSHHNTYANEGVLLVTTTEGTVRSRVGCRVTLLCSGIGTGIEWRQFGSRVALPNDTNRIITIQNSGNEWRSDLIFDPVEVDNEGLYTCIITRESPMVTSSTTVTLTVESDPVAIIPRIQNFNISGYEIGGTLTVGCPVDTCADEVSVTFLKDDDVVDTMDLSNSQITHNLNLLVDEDTVGMYACKVDIDGFSTVQQFNITGTPRPPPPTTGPTTPNTPAPTTTTTTTRPPGTDMNGSPVPTTPDPDSTLTTTTQVPLLVALLAISFALGQCL